jgi:ubiquitin-protein ligase
MPAAYINNKRLATELISLMRNLPMDRTSAVLMRYNESKLGSLKFAIFGPDGTPYSGGMFVFDFMLKEDYPNSSPLVNIVTTGGGTFRFNPNLYAEGKVCLSLLGTWNGNASERWNPAVSSILQVILSIQSLILVDEPYFNEPCYQSSIGTAQGTRKSREYNDPVRLNTMKWAMLEHLKNPLPMFKDASNAHFKERRDEIKEQCAKWVDEGLNETTRDKMKAIYDELCVELDKL